jgi:Family of unknown function (DUF5709)
MTDPHHAQQHDLGDAVQLDNAETLAGPLDDDPLDSGWIPPDRPVAVDRTGVTAREQRDGGSLEERLREEEPEVGEEEPELGEGAREEPDPRAGRLVAPDEGAHADEEPDAVAGDVGVDGGAASAEEAAMHIERER